MGALRASIVIGLASLVVASAASANSTGVLNTTLRDGGGGCTGCHVANASTSVSISGPAAILPGQTVSYTVSVGNGVQGNGGFNAAVTKNAVAGQQPTFSTGTGLGVGDGSTQIVHNPPKATPATWTVSLTMPPTATLGNAYTLYVTGNIGPPAGGFGWAHGANLAISAAPPTPTSITATQASATTTTIPLTWAGTQGEQFKVLRKAGSLPSGANDAGATVVHEGALTSGTASGLAAVTQYFFAAYGRSPTSAFYSAAAATTTAGTLPTNPTSITATPQSSTQISLSWVGTSAEYIVLRKQGATPANPTDGTVVFTGATTTFNDSGLAPGTSYTYRVWGKTPNLAVYSATPAQATATTNLQPTNRYVSVATGNDQAGANTCAAQVAPCKTITRAMAASGQGDVINVSAGTYSVATGEVFPIAFKSGVQLVSSSGAAATIIDGAGDTVKLGLVKSQSNTLAAKIEGFTFRNGLNVADNFSFATGGAVQISSSTGVFTVSRNVFANNTARGYGPVQPGDQATPQGAWGGALYTFSSKVDVLNNVFVGNRAQGGSGLAKVASTFDVNGDGREGQGGAVFYSGDGRIANNTFHANIAQGGNASTGTNGAALRGAGTGGAIFAYANTSLTVANNSLTANAAVTGAGSVDVSNPSSAGAYKSASGAPTVSNNLFFGNLLDAAASTGDTLGTATVTADPQYAAAPTDFHIPGSSPARAAGTSAPAPSTDFDGLPRPIPPAIGAFEPQFLTPGAVLFGGQSVGTTSPGQVVTIANVGFAPITISAVTTTANFSVTHNCTSLALGASCTATVYFTPLAAGSIGGTLTVSTSGGSLNAPLAGTGELSLVTHYYRSILRRAPDAPGKAFWESEATRVSATLGANLNETWFAMAQSFYASAEYASFNRDDTGYVTDLYNTFFNRAPDGPGLAYWVGQLQQGLPRDVLLATFMFSEEFRVFTLGIFGSTTVRPEIDMVIDFYRGILGRLPDSGGFTYWLGQFRLAQCQGGLAVYAQVEAISGAFTGSGEYAGRNRSANQFTGDIYNAFLRRGGDLAGVLFWVNQVASNAKSREQVRQDFIQSAEFSNRVGSVVVAGCLP